MHPQAEVRHDRRVGGLIQEVWPTGGALYGTITVYEEGKRHASVAHGFMGGACTISNEESVEAEGEGTRMRKSLRFWGIVPEETERMFREGAASMLERALKQYCEEGKRYEPNA